MVPASARAVIERHGLAPHPEGGWYRETWRDDALERGHASLILFLLSAGERSHWHRIDAVELWLYHAGAPLLLKIARDGAPIELVRLAPELPQAIVPTRAWQAAESTGEWTLVGCVVAPAFSFDRFELAPDGWHP